MLRTKVARNSLATLDQAEAYALEGLTRTARRRVAPVNLSAGEKRGQTRIVGSRPETQIVPWVKRTGSGPRRQPEPIRASGSLADEATTGSG